MLSRQLLRRSLSALNGAKNASTLVVAEHNGTKVSDGTLATITAASKISPNSVTVLVSGSNASAPAAEVAKVSGVTKVIVASDKAFDHSVAEKISSVVQKLAPSFTHVLAPASNISKNYLPRAAAVLDSSPLNDVSAVVSEDTFKRPMYAGNAIATVKMADKVKFMTIRTTSFEKASIASNNAAVETSSEVPCAKSSGLSEFVSESVAKSDRPDLSSAKVVVSGGRGVKSAENFPVIFKLADKLKGAVGASRAAVDAGFISNEHQVGQTGKVVAPDLYVAVGISGAIQHISGMKDSKVIVAINKDKEAPIFQIADYGLVDDLFKAVPEMTDKL